MKEKYGIILLDTSEIIIRIYETDSHEWRLLHYHDNHTSSPSSNSIMMAEEIAHFLDSEPAAQHVIEWKTCAKNLPQPMIQQIATITGLTIENITPLREQELLCKGIFTELW